MKQKETNCKKEKTHEKIEKENKLKKKRRNNLLPVHPF